MPEAFWTPHYRTLARLGRFSMRCFQLMQFLIVAPRAALCVALLATGCGSRTSDVGSGTGSAPTGSERLELDIAHCAGFGPAEAAAILGVPAEKFQDKSQDISEGSRWCILENADDRQKGVTFTVSRAKSVDEAAEEFSQFRQNAQVAVGTIGERGQKSHEISGLGDEALWAAVPGGVYLRKGRYSVQVNQPAEEATQIRIARKILGE